MLKTNAELEKLKKILTKILVPLGDMRFQNRECVLIDKIAFDKLAEFAESIQAEKEIANITEKDFENTTPIEDLLSDLCDFGLKKYRIQANLTQKELAKKMNLPQSCISRWERGVIPQSKNLKMLAKILNCDIDDLLAVKSGKKSK